MTTITANLTVTLAGDDADAVNLIAEHLRAWLAREGGFQLEAAILDNAPPEYPLEDEDAAGNPTDALLTYEAFTSSGWRLDVALTDVRLRRPQRAYLCVVCGENPDDPDAGFDTCASCAERV